MKARENPFRVERLSAIGYRLRGATWQELLGRLERFQYRAAVVGPEGRGKTTLVEQIGWRLKAEGLRPRVVTLRRGQRRLGSAQKRAVNRSGPGDLLVVDGAQELSWLTWRSLVRRSRNAGGLLITSHRAGRLPTLIECETSPGLLEELLRELDPSGIAHLPPAAELYERHGGNLRAALLEAYDLCAEAPG